MKPILLFDCCSIVSLLCKNKAEILCAGRHQMYTEVLDCLFSRLSLLNAELIFFLDGFIMETKFTEWAKRQNRKYFSSIQVLEEIYMRIPLENIAQHSSAYTNTVLNVIEASCIKHGQLFYAVKSECDQEIARFACSNQRVLAVFSNDTDFMIFSGNWRYFSIKEIDLEKLTTMEFDRKALQHQLRLNNFQMALFATLAGNDIIQENKPLISFHNSLGAHSNKKLPAIASFIRKILSRSNDYQSLLYSLGQKIYGNTAMNTLNCLHSSIMSYSVQDSDTSWSSIYLHQHQLFTYNVLNQSPLNLSLVYFDLRQTDMPSYFDMSVSLLQRQAGIVLMHSTTPDANLTVYTKLKHTENYTKIVLPTVKPPFQIPLLEELYSDEPSFNDDRYKLLKWTLKWEKEHLERFDLQDIPDNYMIDELTIMFMVEKKIISSKEADIFLWTIKNVENGTVPKGIKPPIVLDPRAFRLAFLYVKLFANVARSIEVCGLKKRYWVNPEINLHNMHILVALFCRSH